MSLIYARKYQNRTHESISFSSQAKYSYVRENIMIHCVTASSEIIHTLMYKSRHWRAALNAICSARFLSQQRDHSSASQHCSEPGPGLEPFSTLEFSDPTISDTKTSGTVGEPSYPPTSSAEYQISDPKSRIQNLGSKTSVTELPNQLG